VPHEIYEAHTDNSNIPVYLLNKATQARQLWLKLNPMEAKHLQNF